MQKIILQLKAIEKLLTEKSIKRNFLKLEPNWVKKCLPQALSIDESLPTGEWVLIGGMTESAMAKMAQKVFLSQSLKYLIQELKNNTLELGKERIFFLKDSDDLMFIYSYDTGGFSYYFDDVDIEVGYRFARENSMWFAKKV